MLTAGWIAYVDVAALEAAVKGAPADVARMLVMRDSARFHGGPQFASSAALATASSATHRMRTNPLVHCMQQSGCSHLSTACMLHVH